MATQSIDDRTIVPGSYLDEWEHDGDKGADTVGSNPKKRVVVSNDAEQPLVLGSGISTDSWGVQKITIDQSLYHGMFTFEVPQEYWKECLNYVEQTGFTNALSIDGELVLSSNGVLDDSVVLDTFRNPRYQPNRGYHHACSLFLPLPGAQGIRRWGSFTQECGLFFELEGFGAFYTFSIVSRTTNSGITTDTKTGIQTENFPPNFNPEKGNIYDIQAQMRMVGNFMAYIGDEETGASGKVLTVNNLNKLDNLSLFNPAFPLAFECINKGDDVTIRAGCVDISSEGGSKPAGFYGSMGIDNQAGQVAISGFNVPILVVKNRMTVPVSGFRNTRDLIQLLATAYSDQRCVFRVWATRDETAITLNDQTWIPFRDGIIEYLQYDNPNVATPITFDTTKAELIFTARVDMDQSYSTSALFEGRTDIFQTPGDVFIFTMHRETGQATNVGVTDELAEEV